MNCNNNNSNKIAKILEKIVYLQNCGENTPSSCDKPFLGNITLIANTRVINLYTCSSGTLWEIPYTLDGITQTSPFFKVESVNDNTATFRILAFDGTVYTATNDYFTIKLSCISAIKCLQDVQLAL